MDIDPYKPEAYSHYFEIQQKLSLLCIRENRLPSPIHYVAGTDVAYAQNGKWMVGGIVVLDANSLEVVEESHHTMEVTFPYIPGLFSFREIPSLLEAYQKLSVKPDLIVCDAQGIAHPHRVGMATHLGIELDVPTIGCAKKRLAGIYDINQLGNQRGSTQALMIEDEQVGVALRTQDGIKPLFVSIGHRIGLDTAIDWVLRLCPEYRLPETTRKVDHLVNKILSEEIQ